MELTFKEVLERGIKEVIIKSYGFYEGRIMSTFQPWQHKRDVLFHVKPLGPDDGYLHNDTFFLKEDEDELTYILKEDGKVYVDDPLIGADIDY